MGPRVPATSPAPGPHVSKVSKVSEVVAFSEVSEESLPLSEEELEELELLEEVERDRAPRLRNSYSGIKKRETYVKKNFVDLYGGREAKFRELFGAAEKRLPRLVKVRRKARWDPVTQAR